LPRIDNGKQHEVGSNDISESMTECYLDANFYPMHGGGFPGTPPDVVPDPFPPPDPEPDGPGFPEPDPDPSPLDPEPKPVPVNYR
jgi:hypothetical protein